MWRFVRKRDLRERLPSYMCHFEKRALRCMRQKTQQKSRLRKSRMGVIKMREASGSPSFLDDGVVQHRGLKIVEGEEGEQARFSR